jgi:uncharacterized protein
MLSVIKILTSVALLVGLLACAANAQDKKKVKDSTDVVKATAKADKPNADSKQIVTVTLAIDRDWHTYANPVGLDDLQNAETVVEISGKNKPLSVKIDYPKGKLQKDEVVGDYSIYEGKVEIKATVQRDKGDSGPLEVKVRFQACSDVSKTCLIPATVKLSVE